MNILGLDTSTEYAALIVASENGHCYQAILQRHERNLSSRLYGLIDALLEGRGLSFKQVDAFAVGLGPGSFTGVRVAVTTMRTFAQVTGKPLVGVPTMDIFARSALQHSGWSTPKEEHAALVLLPSRRDEAYAQLYFAAHGTSPQPAMAASYAQAHALAQKMDGGIVTGPSSLLETLFGSTEMTGITFVPQETPHTVAFAELAAEAVREERFQNPLSLDPMYVAPPAISQHKAKLVGP